MQNDQHLILQAIESAERSLSVARQLLGGGASKDKGPVAGNLGQVNSSELLGEVGVFDGENLITEDGRKFQVPPNYASKSLLVVGDVMRMITGSDGIKRFKQIRKVSRITVDGVLAKKDGRWAVVTEQGTFKVLSVSVKYFDSGIGDKAQVIIPKDYSKLKVKWAALEKADQKATEPTKQAKPIVTPKTVEKTTAELKPKPKPVRAVKPLPKNTPKRPPRPSGPIKEKLPIKGEVKVEDEELR